MAEELTFVVKLKKSLYGMGLKNMGPALLTELKKGGDEWIQFVYGLFEGTDYATRKEALKQLTGKGFLQNSRARAQLVDLLQLYLVKGMSDEKKMALKFIEQNLALFPTDDDTFRAKILGLRREKDSQLSALAESLLPKIGIDMDDREMYRNR